MKLLINNVDYSLLNDYTIKEQAGATSVITVNVKIDDKRIPQPYDSVIIKTEELDAGGDILSDNNYKDNTEILNDVLSVEKNEIYYYKALYGRTWGELF